ncbi:MAG TPA: carboxypeptidase-like regulatory domain-containing protein, partial [Saprospiraceae bacterium]|nr:carboxypeptidase-like regulatory domain-containing protein [Saprospiraceae bacterium]
LPETIIFPWPSRERFTTDFLAMDVSHAIQEKAKENLARESLEKLRFEVPKDAREYTSYYSQQFNQKYYYMGQTPPMNIFNPLAWAQFFKEWKQGKYKKKK